MGKIKIRPDFAAALVGVVMLVWAVRLYLVSIDAWWLTWPNKDDAEPIAVRVTGNGYVLPSDASDVYRVYQVVSNELNTPRIVTNRPGPLEQENPNSIRFP